MSTLLSAALGGLVGNLYLTERGRRVRGDRATACCSRWLVSDRRVARDAGHAAWLALRRLGQSDDLTIRLLEREA